MIVIPCLYSQYQQAIGHSFIRVGNDDSRFSQVNSMVRKNVYSSGILDISQDDEAVTGQYLTVGRDGPYVWYFNSAYSY